MPKEETIQITKVRNVIGEKENLPSLNARSTLSSIIRSIVTKLYGVPQLIHLYGALGLNKTLTFDTGESFVYALFSDGTYLYAGLFTIPGKVVKVDLSTFTKVSTLTFDAGENYVTSVLSDGTYLYAGLNTAPGKVIKVDLSTFTKVSTLTLDTGKDNIYSLFSDGTYLYVGFFVYLGLVKVDLSTFAQVNTLMFDAGENSAYSLFLDGVNLYAALNTSPGKILKVDLSTFTKVSTLTLDTGENGSTSLFSDGTYLYAALYTVPGKVVMVDLTTFTKISTLTFGTGDDYSYSLFSDGTYLYTGLATAPGKVTRKYIIPSIDQHQRKIGLINEQTHSGVYSLYPTLADGVVVTSGAGVYVMGAYVQIIPANTITKAFYITSIFLNRVSGNAGFEVEVATGAAASESKIATVFVRTDILTCSNVCVLPIPIKVASNTRISARSADSTGSLTVRVRIHYKT